VQISNTSKTDIDLEEKLFIVFEIRLLNLAFNESLDDPKSRDFQELKAKLEAAWTDVFHDMPGFLFVNVTGFRQGSVITKFLIVFNDTSYMNRSDIMGHLDSCNGTELMQGYLYGHVTTGMAEKSVKEGENTENESKKTLIPRWVIALTVVAALGLFILATAVVRFLIMVN